VGRTTWRERFVAHDAAGLERVREVGSRAGTRWRETVLVAATVGERWIYVHSQSVGRRGKRSG